MGSRLPLLLLLLLLVSGATEAADASKSTGETLTPLEKSVEPFYSLTEKFLDLVQPVDRSEVIEDFVRLLANDTDNFVTNFPDTWQAYARRYASGMLGYTILISLGLLFAISLPLAGLIVCSCRCCCGNCGGRLHHMERKGAKCRRVVYGLLLTLLATFMLCGIVLSLITNQLARGSVSPGDENSAVAAAGAGLRRLSWQLEAAAQRAGNRSSDAEASVSEAVPAAANASALALSTAVGRDSGAEAALADLRAVAAAAKAANVSLTAAKEELSEYQSAKQEVAERRRAAPGNVSEVRLPATEKLVRVQAYRGYDIRVMLNFLKKIVGPADRGLAASEASLAAVAAAARGQLEPTRADIAAAVLTGPELQASLVVAQRCLSGLADQFRNLSQAATTRLFVNPVTNEEQTLPQYVAGLDSFRYYVSIGLAVLAGVVVLFYFLGLAFGFCGEPPYEDSRFCNRGAGANFLLAGSGCAFVYAWVIVLFVVTFFTSFGVMDTELCRHLMGRSGAGGRRILDRAANDLLGGNAYCGRLRVASGLLGDCRGWRSPILDAADLARGVKVKDAVARGAEAAGRRLLERRRDIVDAVSINGSYEVMLQVGSWSPIETMGIVTGNLSTWLAANRRTAERLRQVGGDELAASLERLTASSRRLLRSLELAVGAWTTLEARGAGLAARLAEAQQAAQAVDNYTSAVSAARAAFAESLESGLVAFVSGSLAASADCPGLRSAARASVSGVCDRLLRPLNAYWAGLGFFLLCLLPCLVLTVKLANLYRKTNKYEKDYDEPDYMAYQGFYPADTMPLDG